MPLWLDRRRRTPGQRAGPETHTPKLEAEDSRMIKPGADADGIAQTESDHFMKCPGCGEWFDMRDLGEVIEHVHDAEIEIIGGPGQRPAAIRARRRPSLHWSRVSFPLRCIAWQGCTRNISRQMTFGPYGPAKKRAPPSSRLALPKNVGSDLATGKSGPSRTGCKCRKAIRSARRDSAAGKVIKLTHTLLLGCLR